MLQNDTTYGCFTLREGMRANSLHIYLFFEFFFKESFVLPACSFLQFAYTTGDGMSCKVDFALWRRWQQWRLNGTSSSSLGARTPQVWHAPALIAQAHLHCAVLGENYLNAQRSAQSQQWQRCHTVSYSGIGWAFLETALLAVSPSFPAAARPLMWVEGWAVCWRLAKWCCWLSPILKSHFGIN